MIHGIEEMPSETGEQHPPPPEKKQKIEGKEEEEAEVDDSEDKKSVERVADHRLSLNQYWKDLEGKISENLLNKLKNAPYEYDPDPDSDYLVDGQTEVDWETWNIYHKQIKETQGFGVKVYPGPCWNAYLVPIPDFKERDSVYKLVTELADLAIKQYNKDNGKEFKLVDVEWVVMQATGGIMYYLTFTASDSKGLKTFEAMILLGIFHKKEVELCRLKKQEATTSN